MRQVLVVGGQLDHVPAWVRERFELTHVSGENGRGQLKLSQDYRPDLVLLITAACSHNYSNQARALAKELAVPLIQVQKGYSQALEWASKMGLGWFVEAAKNMPADLAAPARLEDPGASTGPVDRQQDKIKHLEKRLERERLKREELEARLAKIKSGAEERVIQEIRKRAREIREAALSDAKPEVREAALQVAKKAKELRDNTGVLLLELGEAVIKLDQALTRNHE